MQTAYKYLVVTSREELVHTVYNRGVQSSATSNITLRRTVQDTP